MYILKAMNLPKGFTINEYIRFLMATFDEEEAKEKVFRLTYRLGLRELRHYANMTTVEDGLGPMSVAFIKTYNNFDPCKEDASFMNYYKLAIKTEIINDKFRNYRATKEKREILYAAENTMESLDEPVYDKNDKVTGTKACVIPDDYNIEEDILFEDLKNDIYKTIDKVFDTKPKYKPATKEIFKYYMGTLMDDAPENYTEIAKRFDKSGSYVRKLCIKNKELFLKLWEERELV